MHCFALLEPPRLFCIKDAAQYLGTTPWAIRSLIWSGKLKHIRLGKRFLIDRRDLDAFIETQKEVA